MIGLGESDLHLPASHSHPLVFHLLDLHIIKGSHLILLCSRCKCIPCRLSWIISLKFITNLLHAFSNVDVVFLIFMNGVDLIVVMVF